VSSGADRTIDRATAHRLAEERLREIEELFDEPVALAIDDTRTVDLEFGWVFCWDAAEAVASGDERAGIDGNSPILVTTGGFVAQGDSAHAIEDYIEIWREVFTGPPLDAHDPNIGPSP
jgi:hypothetical protein